MNTALTTETILAALPTLPGWRYQEDKLHKRFQFVNFREAISFLVRLSFEAEALDHHPEIHNIYQTVDINLTTHDAGNRVTEKDLALAKAIESFNWL